MRKPYLDNIRWAVVLVVLVYHVFYLFNHAGVPGAIAHPPGTEVLDVFLYFVYPWFMVLLFLVAGVSARYSLQKRSGKQFLRERVTKLLVPSTLGLFVYHWVTGYLNIRLSGVLDSIPGFLRYPISVISGIGPLWFAQTLFLFSLGLLLVRRLDGRDRLWNLCAGFNTVGLLLLVFPIWGAAQLLNLPLLTMYRFGIYGTAFLLGYFVFSQEGVQVALERAHLPLLGAAVLLGISYVATYFGADYTSPRCLQSFFTNLYLWVAVLAILGCAKAWCDHSTPLTRYLAGASFGFYVVHYPIVMVVCCLLYRYSGLPPLLMELLALALELGLTPVVYRLFCSIPVLRYLVLGVRGKAGQRAGAATGL